MSDLNNRNETTYIHTHPTSHPRGGLAGAGLRAAPVPPADHPPGRPGQPRLPGRNGGGGLSGRTRPPVAARQPLRAILARPVQLDHPRRGGQGAEPRRAVAGLRLQTERRAACRQRRRQTLPTRILRPGTCLGLPGHRRGCARGTPGRTGPGAVERGLALLPQRPPHAQNRGGHRGLHGHPLHPRLRAGAGGVGARLVQRPALRAGGDAAPQIRLREAGWPVAGKHPVWL